MIKRDLGLAQRQCGTVLITPGKLITCRRGRCGFESRHPFTHNSNSIEDGSANGSACMTKPRLFIESDRNCAAIPCMGFMANVISLDAELHASG